MWLHKFLKEHGCWIQRESPKMKWMEHMHGMSIFPKHPHELQKWERKNRRVEKAVEIAVLEPLNKKHTPEELKDGNSDFLMADVVDTDADVGAGMTNPLLLNCPRAPLPEPAALPPAQLFRPIFEQQGHSCR